jgi:tripeptide aminopeptidase
VRRATDADRDQLHRTFASLCRLESPTGHERPVADWLTRELTALGLEVAEDGAAADTGCDAGNLLARIPGAGAGSLMFCAHMDTVPLDAPVEPELVEGGWRNANPGILGADNKAAVAVLVELARRLTRGPAPRTGLELIFTVAEETGLHGAKAFDVSGLRSRFGYVFDHASPVGEIVVAAPTHHRFIAELRGRAAHAGVRPEDGRNAIVAAAAGVVRLPQGRLDEDLTLNVGTISGGSTVNVVAEHCRVQGEIRGHDDRRVEALLTEVIDHFQDAADSAECDLDIEVERMFRAYRQRPRSPQVELAEQALQACGYRPRHISSGGGSDANAFEAQGFNCVCLADGTERNHEPEERISADALEGMLEVAIALHEHFDPELSE